MLQSQSNHPARTAYIIVLHTHSANHSAMKISLLWIALANALVPQRGALPTAPRRRSGSAAPTMICPLAPLAPVWIAGKAMIEGRRKFFPDSEPWPRAWEESDVWLENSISFGPKKSQSRAAGAAECPIPVEARQGAERPPASQ